MRKNARWLAASISIVVAAVMAGCGGSSTPTVDGAAAGSSGSKTELRVGIGGAGASLNPAKDAEGDQMVMRSLAYDSLVRMQPDGSYEPALATSWRYVGDGNKVFELTLRSDVVFSDGTELTAEGVKKWLEYLLENSPLAGNFGKVRKIETPDARTVRITLADPNPVLPYLLSDQMPTGAVVSPKAITAPDSLNGATSGAGPYVLEPSETVSGDQYTYVPNDTYFDKSAIKYEKVTVKIIADPTSMVQAATTGQLDVAAGAFETAAAAEQAGLSVVDGPGGLWFVVFQDRTGKTAPPLADKRVRQALNYAIDRQSIVSALYGDYGEPTSELLTAGSFDPEYQSHYGYDPEKAKSLLAEAGYADGFSLKVLTGSYPGNDGSALTQAIAQNLSEVGVKLDVTTAATQADLSKSAFNGTMPTLVATYRSYPMPLPWSTLIGPDAPLNTFHAREPALERLYREGSVAKDPTSAWTQLSRGITEQALMLPVAITDLLWYVSDDVTGVAVTANATQPNPTQWSPK